MDQVEGGREEGGREGGREGGNDIFSHSTIVLKSLSSFLFKILKQIKLEANGFLLGNYNGN